MEKKIKRVAFIVPEFPAVSLTFIINQIADLLDRGVDVEIFAFQQGSLTSISDRYFKYGMKERTHLLSIPAHKILRVLKACILVAKMSITAPRALLRALDPAYGILTYSLSTLYWTDAFLHKKFDVVHCHFGTVATKYAVVRKILEDNTPFVVTFYGYDISHIPLERGMDFYHELGKTADTFFVMSENMKSRVLPLGIPEEKVHVLPISIDVDSYPYAERTLQEGEVLEITSVGRFVEKKGFDDLLRAIKLVKEKTQTPFKLNIVGDGELHDEIHSLAKELEVTDVVDFKGYMKLEDVLALYEKSHLYVQASKTASDGDME